MREVWPQNVSTLIDDLRWVKTNYHLPKSSEKAIAKAIWALTDIVMTPSAAPLDPDIQMPVLAPANAESARDRDDIRRARVLLCSDMRTCGLSDELGRLDHWGKYGSIAGWRWLRAANVIFGPRVDEELRGNWHYFCGIAMRFRETDRDRPIGARDVPALCLDDLKGMSWA